MGLLVMIDGRAGKVISDRNPADDAFYTKREIKVRWTDDGFGSGYVDATKVSFPVLELEQDSTQAPEADSKPALEPRPEHGARAATKLLRDEALQAEGGAKASDARLTGRYVIVMDCATCDLGSDISHGHYAGWDKERERVRSLLRGAAKCFLRGCEEKGLIHGDIKPMNIVLSTEAGAPVLKLIDFDASARHGAPCHL